MCGSDPNALKIIKKYLEDARKLCAAFMNQEKAYARVYKKGLWGVLRISGVGMHFLEKIPS